MEVLKASKHQFPFLTGIGIGPLRERSEDVLINKLVDPQKPKQQKIHNSYCSNTTSNIAQNNKMKEERAKKENISSTCAHCRTNRVLP